MFGCYTKSWAFLVQVGPRLQGDDRPRYAALALLKVQWLDGSLSCLLRNADNVYMWWTLFGPGSLMQPQAVCRGINEGEKLNYMSWYLHISDGYVIGGFTWRQNSQEMTLSFHDCLAYHAMKEVKCILS